ncbi:hypothetical protein T439DRAFT_375837 [Meredithblackwellia eburnea MCA 4105]
MPSSPAKRAKKSEKTLRDLRLPLELIREIIHLAPTDNCPNSGAPRGRYKTLVNFTRVSRAWNYFSTPLLWKCVHVTSTRGLHSLTQILLNKHQLRTRVSWLWIDLQATTRLPRGTTSSWSTLEEDWEKHVAVPERLEGGRHLLNAKPLREGDLARLLRLCPDLLHCHLTNIPILEFHALFSARNLQSLEIISYRHLKFDNRRRIYDSFKSLRYLSLELSLEINLQQALDFFEAHILKPEIFPSLQHLFWYRRQAKRHSGPEPYFRVGALGRQLVSLHVGDLAQDDLVIYMDDLRKCSNLQVFHTSTDMAAVFSRAFRT